jgi:hypothetical protein
MFSQLLSTSRLLLSIPPVSLQPLSHLFGLRMLFSFLFLPSSPLLFPSTPAFFLPHIPLLVLAAAVFVLLLDHLRLLAAAVFVLLLDHLRLLTTAGFFLLPNCLRLLSTALFFFHPSYRLSLPPRGLPLASHLF